MSDIKDWADDADLNGEASPAGWPEGMPPSDVNNSAREMMAALRRSYVRQPWYAPGGEIVRASGTQITIRDDAKVTDYSQYYSINQRVRVEGEEYNVTGSVSSISYEAPTTTIEFEMDAELPLPGTIKDVYVGLSPSDVQGVAGPNLLGCIIGFTEEASQIGAGLLHANGQRFSPSLYPDLARLYFMGNNSDGTPNYRYGRERVGNEWWPKRPDVRGYFPRFLDDRAAGDSSRVDLGSPRVVGSKQADDNKSHIHPLRVHLGTENTKDNRNSYIAGNNYSASAERGMWHTAANATNNVSIANQGSESRPKNIAVVGVIVAYGGVVAGGLADVSEVLEDVRTTKELAQSLSVTIANLGDVMRYMGSVATYDDLPTVDNQVGDVYNVLDTGANYAWTAAGTWDAFGGLLPDNVALNNASDENSLAIGTGSTSSDTNNVALGYNAKARSFGGTAVGASAQASANGVAVGQASYVEGTWGVAVGQGAQTTNTGGIQIGRGYHTEENAMYVGLGISGNYKLLGSDGKIPTERLPDDIGGDAGRVTQLGFNGVLEGGVLTFTPAEGSDTVYDIQDFYAYEIDLLFEAVGEIDDNVTMVIKNGNDTYNIVNVLHDDPTTSATVGDMKQIMKYSTDIGWRWIFNVRATTTQAGDKVLVMPSTVTAVQEASSYKSLDETQKTQLLLDGTYKGADVVDGEVFTEYDGKFVEFDKTLNSGYDWISYPLPSDLEFVSNLTQNEVAYGNGKFVVACSYYDASKILSSVDGKNWKDVTPSGIGKNQAHYASFENGRFIVKGRTSNYSQKYWVSEDGDNWTQGSLPSEPVSGYSWCNIVYGNGVYVVGCGHSNAMYFATSTDLVSWTSHSYGSGFPINSPRIAFGNGVFVAISYDRDYAYSTDGINWTQGSLPKIGSYRGASFSDGLFLTACGSAALKSTDGISWDVMNLPLDVSNSAICGTRGQEILIFANPSSKGLFSQDNGNSWLEVSSVSESGLPYGDSGSGRIATNGTTFVVTGFSGKGSIFTIALAPFYEYSLLPLSYTKEEVDNTLEGSGYLKNTATGSESLTIAGTASTYTQSLNIGYSSSVTANYGTAVGRGATAANNSTALGYNAKAQGTVSVAVGHQANAYGRESVVIGTGNAAAYTPHSVAIGYMAGCGGSSSDSYEGATAIGYNAKSRAAYAIQLGYGRNSTANTLSVGLSGSLNVQLLDANGKIPAERLPDSVATAALMSNSTEADYAIAYGEGATAEEAGTSTGYNSTSLNYSVSYGYTADATGLYSVALGASSQTTSDYATAVGYNAHAMGEHAIQIGYGNNTEAHTMRVAVDQNRNFLLLDENGDIPAERTMNGLITIGSGAPTTATEGFLGKVYIDSTNSQAYICVGDAVSSWVWKQITS